jgi:acylphosphatase
LEKALELGIKGWVRNCSDRSIEVEAEGKKMDLKKFISWCHHGPSGAIVSKVDVSKAALKNFPSFQIKR